ncbi:SDR family NAD(P)-dependent oxidoreductase [Amycolatopsis thermoflava]|uniref:SDR family NAD(P)-dependent oxidoreductase n=1 Tax=Amycolatopsis thermoflava TaxID=84480 RepID=UPI003656E3D7
MDIPGCVALVTGGSSGLGLATVRKLHREGAHVVIVGRPSSRGKAVADQFGERASFAAADITDEDQVAAAVDVAADVGPLRIVVNCAGVGSAARVVGKRGPFPLEEFARVVEVNLIGTFNVLRLSAEQMVQEDLVGEERGAIVNTASIAAFDGQVGQAAYGASKGGLVAMTLPVARELSRHRIRVNTIAPGLFDTPFLDGLPPAVRSALPANVPHPSRLGRPEEFAELVTHLIRNSMLNGETVRLDGALRMPDR